jgi:hypothetical protein
VLLAPIVMNKTPVQASETKMMLDAIPNNSFTTAGKEDGPALGEGHKHSGRRDFGLSLLGSHSLAICPCQATMCVQGHLAPRPEVAQGSTFYLPHT